MDKIKQFNLALSGITVGLIWVIQLVHYPSFLFIDPIEFSSFHGHHTYYMGVIAAPLMLAELGLGSYLAFKSKKYIYPLVIIIIIWISTFCVQVPLHNQLEDSMDQEVIQQLIQTNWIRTGLWSLKLVILFFIKID